MNYYKENWTDSRPNVAEPPTDTRGAPALDLRSLVGLVRRRWLLILGSILVCVALGGAALFLLKPVYTATALLLVDPSNKNLLDGNYSSWGTSSDTARVESEVELVRSDVVLREVIRDLGLISDKEFGVRIGTLESLGALVGLGRPELPSGEEALNSVQSRLRSAVTVQRRGLTFLIAVNATSSRAETAAQLANTIAQTYISQQLRAKRGAVVGLADVLGTSLEQARASVNSSEQLFDEFLERNRLAIATAAGDFSALYEKLVALRGTVQQENERLALAEQETASEDWQALARTLQSEALIQLEAQRTALVQQLSGSAADGPSQFALRDELTKLEGQLSLAASQTLSDLRQRVSGSRGQVTLLRDQIQTALVGTQLPTELQTQIFETLENAQTARTQYQALLARQQELTLQAGLQVADSRLASPAIAPGSPSFPNSRLILIFALALGIALGLALAFVVENFVGGITSADQLETVIRASTGSTIPRYRQSQGDISPADAMATAPLSAFAESIRRIRLSLEQLQRSKLGESRKGSVIMVTSALPNEGKSTAALSLARAYAMAGKSTLLVDCDLRKPGIHQQLGVQPAVGLFEYLTQPADHLLKSMMVIDSRSEARVLLGSRRSDIATDQLIGGKGFAGLVDAARKGFDVVVLDTPPIGLVVDGLYAATLCDAIVLIVKWSTTPQQNARAAVRMLSKAMRSDAGLVGVLNQEKASGRKDYGSGYYSKQ